MERGDHCLLSAILLRSGFARGVFDCASKPARGRFNSRRDETPGWDSALIEILGQRAEHAYNMGDYRLAVELCNQRLVEIDAVLEGLSTSRAGSLLLAAQALLAVSDRAGAMVMLSRGVVSSGSEVVEQLGERLLRSIEDA